MTARIRQSAKKMPEVHFVIFVSTLPEPAPNSASVAPPPKATPMPASFLGNCNSTRNTKMMQSSTKKNVKNPIIKLIISKPV